MLAFLVLAACARKRKEDVSPLLRYLKHEDKQRRMRSVLRVQLKNELNKLGIADSIVDSVNMLQLAKQKMKNAKRLVSKMSKAQKSK